MMSTSCAPAPPKLVIGQWVAAPSTIGTFLRAFTWGHARQLDAVSGELLARAWKAGAGPGDTPFTFDIDFTICETYGIQKQGGSKFTYTKTLRVSPPARGRCRQPHREPAPATSCTTGNSQGRL